MAFGECLGVAQQDTTGGPLWRATSGRRLESYDAEYLLVGCVMAMAAGENNILLKDGIELSHTCSSVPPDTGPIS